MINDFPDEQCPSLLAGKEKMGLRTSGQTANAISSTVKDSHHVTGNQIPDANQVIHAGGDQVALVIKQQHHCFAARMSRHLLQALACMDIPYFYFFSPGRGKKISLRGNGQRVYSSGMGCQLMQTFFPPAGPDLNFDHHCCR